MDEADHTNNPGLPRKVYQLSGTGRQILVSETKRMEMVMEVLHLHEADKA